MRISETKTVLLTKALAAGIAFIAAMMAGTGGVTAFLRDGENPWPVTQFALRDLLGIAFYLAVFAILACIVSVWVYKLVMPAHEIEDTGDKTLRIILGVTGVVLTVAAASSTMHHYPAMTIVYSVLAGIMTAALAVIIAAQSLK